MQKTFEKNALFGNIFVILQPKQTITQSCYQTI